MHIGVFTKRAAWILAAAAACSAALVIACSSPNDEGGPKSSVDAGAADSLPEDSGAAPDGAPDGSCTETFGTSLTMGFGRIDGTVYAIQKPGERTCAQPDEDFLVLQVMMDGEVYRLLVDVGTDRGGASTQIHMATVPHEMPQPEYAEGWQTGVPLDYANMLGVHSADGGFALLSVAEAVTKIAAEVKVGDPVSVYATSALDHPERAEIIRRNTPGKNEDGAIVVRPTSGAPTFLLFHQADQKF